MVRNYCSRRLRSYNGLKSSYRSTFLDLLLCGLKMHYFFDNELLSYILSCSLYHPESDN